MYVVLGTVMVRIDKNDLVVIPVKDREKFVLNTHLDTLVPHMGGDKSMQKIREVVYVVGLHAVAGRIISLCGRCAQNKRLSLAEQNAPLQPMPISQSIGERWYIYAWGPFADNYKKDYIIGAVESLTKFFVAKVTNNKSMNTFTSFIMNEIVYRFGVPGALVSDQAKEIPGLKNNLIKVLGIQCITTSAYSPRSTGEMERRWRTMREFFHRNTPTTFNDKQELLPVFLFACNISPCKTTGHSPFYLMVGYTPSSARIYKYFCPTSIKALTDATRTMQGNFEKLVNEPRKIETNNTL